MGRTAFAPLFLCAVLPKIRSSYFYCRGKSERLIFRRVERMLKNRSFPFDNVENSDLFFRKIPIIFRKRTSSCKKMSLFEKSCHLIFRKNKMTFLLLLSFCAVAGRRDDGFSVGKSVILTKTVKVCRRRSVSVRNRPPEKLFQGNICP